MGISLLASYGFAGGSSLNLVERLGMGEAAWSIWLRLFTVAAIFYMGRMDGCSTRLVGWEALAPWVSGVVNPSMPRSKISPQIFPSSSLAQITAISAYGALLIHIFEPFNK